MRHHALEDFLYRFDKDTELQRRFIADPNAALAAEAMPPEDKRVVAARDVVTLLHWGIHPLLIRNFAGTLKVDYLAAYRDAGLDMTPPWPRRSSTA